MDNIDLKNLNFNRVAQRGDPTKAVLDSGHTVYKMEYLIMTKPDDGAEEEHAVTMEAADYHDEHFVYIDPKYEETLHDPTARQWFAMCTCGSPAVAIDAFTAMKLGIPIKTHQIVVCHFYTSELAEKGEHAARHQTSYVNRREVKRGKRVFKRKKRR